MTTPNPLNDDDFYGNDDHIDALKNACLTYACLHDMISGMIEDPGVTHKGIAAITITISHQHYNALVRQLAECTALNVNQNVED